jgi:hypothetical protein
MEAAMSKLRLIVSALMLLFIAACANTPQSSASNASEEQAKHDSW